MAQWTAMLRNPDLLLRAAIHGLATTGNPYYAWEAIQISITHKKKFPSAVLNYLLQCAERMQSREARQTQDLRKSLPWVFDFPQGPKAPKHLLDPDGDPNNKPLLAIRFAIRLESEKPSTALRNACNDALCKERADRIDDKTLRAWILREFELKHWPRTRAEWRAACRAHYHERGRQLGELAREFAP